MNIQQQNGIVSTIQFVDFSQSREYEELRESVFHQAKAASNVAPQNRIDVFDESILLFEDHFQALCFLIEMFRVATEFGRSRNLDIGLRSSLCHGSYFVHQDQIYGEAVNLATRLSCTTRVNELQVSQFDRHIIEDFIKSHTDLACYVKSEDEFCVSIAIIDRDSTNARFSHEVLEVEFDGQTRVFETTRNCRILIGRTDDADITLLGDHISRSHATIILKYGDIYLEDHSANGTFVYFDNREIFVNEEEVSVASEGIICCGINKGSKTDSSGLITFRLSEISQSIPAASQLN